MIVSNAGHTKHRSWYLNLMAQPRARVQAATQVIEVTSREAAGEDGPGHSLFGSIGDGHSRDGTRSLRRCAARRATTSGCSPDTSRFSPESMPRSYSSVGPSGDGFTAFVNKPYEPEQLVEAVRASLAD